MFCEWANRILDVPACWRGLRAHVLSVLACLRIHMLGVLIRSCAHILGCLTYSYAFICSRAWCAREIVYSRAWRTYVLTYMTVLCASVLACFMFSRACMFVLILHLRVLHAYVFAYFAWLLCWNVLCAYVLACLMCLFGLFSLHFKVKFQKLLYRRICMLNMFSIYTFDINLKSNILKSI